MDPLTPFRVPAETAEVTYTRGHGEQRSIPIRELEPGYLYAEPEDRADEEHLRGLGLKVARKAIGELEDDDEAEAAPKSRKAAPEKNEPAKAPEPTEKTAEADQPAPPAETAAGSEG